MNRHQTSATLKSFDFPENRWISFNLFLKAACVCVCAWCVVKRSTSLGPGTLQYSAVILLVDKVMHHLGCIKTVYLHNLINFLSTGQGFCLSAGKPSSMGLTTHFGLQVDRCVKTPKPQCMRRCEAASLTSKKKTFPNRGVANTSSCYDS